MRYLSSLALASMVMLVSSSAFSDENTVTLDTNASSSVTVDAPLEASPDVPTTDVGVDVGNIADSAEANAVLDKLDLIPCPNNWSVEINPSIENSLTYLHESGKLSVNVTYVADSISKNASPEAFARVAAQQMNCQLPTRSNLIENAWSFYCDDAKVESIVYGTEGNLVLLSVSGRDETTETFIEDFIRFLNYQSKRN